MIAWRKIKGLKRCSSQKHIEKETQDWAVGSVDRVFASEA